MNDRSRRGFPGGLAAAIALGMSTVVGAAPPQDLVEEARLLETIRSLPAKRSAMPDAEHRKGLRNTETLLLDRLKDLGLSPVTQEFTWTFPARRMNAPGVEPGAVDEATPGAPAADGKPPAEKDERPAAPADLAFRNVIVDLVGTDLRREVILLSAHFDAVPNSPGADDDGSGVAAILELARVLKDHPTRRTIRLALFNLEEVGLVGSRHYAAEFVKASKTPLQDGQVRETIVGMASLEMLGYFADGPNSQKSPLPKIEGVFDPPTVGDSICIVGVAKNQSFSGKLAREMKAAAPDLKVTLVDFMPVPIPDMMRSDHRPFITAGIPAVMITDTADFRNSNYHKPSDTVDTLDPKRFTLVVRALAGAAYALAEPAQKN